MSSTKSLGIVAPVPKGNWNATTAYNKLNIVRYNKASYIALMQNTNMPPSSNSLVWMLIAQDGEEGSSSGVNVQVDGVSILNKDGILQLPSEYIEYLSNQTYAAPAILSFSVSDGGIGVSNPISNQSIWQITGVKHEEKNIDNIVGDLTFTFNNTSTTITKSSTQLEQTIPTNTLTISKPGKYSATLSGRDTKNNTFSSKIEKEWYVPMAYAMTSDENADISSLNFVYNEISPANGGVEVSIFVGEEDQYIFFSRATTFNTPTIGVMDVEMDGEFPVQQTITINGYTASCYVWRTAKKVEKGSTYKIKW